MEERNQTKMNEKEYECVNCSWNGTELSKSCRTLGNIDKDGSHKVIKGLQRCEGCGFIDNKCPVCGDNVGEPGIREKTRLLKEQELKAKQSMNKGYAYI